MTGHDIPNAEYVQPTSIVDSDHPEIIAFATRTSGNSTDPLEQASRLFYAVRDGIMYDPRTPFYLPEHYRASNVLRRGRGFCIPKACLLCASCRTLGIPSRVGFADIRNSGPIGDLADMMGCHIFAYHAFAELYLAGKWVKATPSFDSGLCSKHNIEPLRFDGKTDALFPAKDLNGNPYVEYITYHGSFADIPVDKILEGWRRIYGPDRVNSWIAALEAAKER